MVGGIEMRTLAQHVLLADTAFTIVEFMSVIATNSLFQIFFWVVGWLTLILGLWCLFIVMAL
jgi:hypothetical protein